MKQGCLCPTQRLNISLVMGLLLTGASFSPSSVYVIFWQEAPCKSFEGWTYSLEKHANNVLLWIWVSSFSGKNSNISTTFPAGMIFFFLTHWHGMSSIQGTNRISLPISEPWSCVVSWLLRCDWLIGQKRKEFSMEFSLFQCALRGEHV